jgi:hypothetical protein
MPKAATIPISISVDGGVPEKVANKKPKEPLISTILRQRTEKSLVRPYAAPKRSR